MEQGISALALVWERLQAISLLQFQSLSRTGIGWSGVGQGVVKVSSPAPDVLVFEESGQWQQDGGAKLRFTNVFRWTRVENKLRLEHLRFGVDKPVYLFEMAVDKDGIWRELEPHPCRDDCYSAQMHIEPDSLIVDWSVRGPKRDESIHYIYTC